MNTLLQQALDALKKSYPMQTSTPREHMDAITTLREALAAPALVAQKPAYSEEEIERAVITLRGITQEIRGRGIGAVMLLEEQIKSLSAAPVVREPLTQVQTDEIWDSFEQAPTMSYRYLVTCAIEKAHGIGGGNG